MFEGNYRMFSKPESHSRTTAGRFGGPLPPPLCCYHSCFLEGPQSENTAPALCLVRGRGEGGRGLSVGTLTPKLHLKRRPFSLAYGTATEDTGST